MAGLLPIMLSTGTGSEIMQRIAVPMIGGMESSTLLALIVIPAVFGIVRRFGLATDRGQGRPAAATAKHPKERPAHGGSG
jgi:copper/silver efflux system protein